MFTDENVAGSYVDGDEDDGDEDEDDEEDDGASVTQSDQLSMVAGNDGKKRDQKKNNKTSKAKRKRSRK